MQRVDECNHGQCAAYEITLMPGYLKTSDGGEDYVLDISEIFWCLPCRILMIFQSDDSIERRENLFLEELKIKEEKNEGKSIFCR